MVCTLCAEQSSERGTRSLATALAERTATTRVAKASSEALCYVGFHSPVEL